MNEVYEKWVDQVPVNKRAETYFAIYAGMMIYGQNYGKGPTPVAYGGTQEGDEEHPTSEFTEEVPDFQDNAPLLRFGLHEDKEAKRYIVDHPDTFALPDGAGGTVPFALDYNRVMDSFIHYNVYKNEGSGDTRREQFAVGARRTEQMIDRQPASDDVTSDPRQDIEFGATLDDTTMGENEGANAYVEGAGLLPVDQMRNDLRNFLPFEKELGFNVWPATLALATVALVPLLAPKAIPVAMSPLIGAAARWATFQAANPSWAKTLSAAHTLGWGVTAVASGNLIASVADAAQNPGAVGELTDKAIAEANQKLEENAMIQDAYTTDRLIIAAPEDWVSILGGDIDRTAVEPDYDVDAELEAVREIAQQQSAQAPEWGGVPQAGGPTTGEIDEAAIANVADNADFQALASSDPEAALDFARTAWFQDLGGVNEPAPSPFVGQGIAGSPITAGESYETMMESYQFPSGARALITPGGIVDPAAQFVGNVVQERTRISPYTTQRNTFAQGIENATIGGAAVSAPMPATYTEEDYTRIVGSMTPGQIETFTEKAIGAGLISEDYAGTGFMDQVVTGAIEQVMYQANLSGHSWQESLDLMVDAYQGALEEKKKENLADWYANFVPSQPYVTMDYATIAQAVKGTIKDRLGRDANQWEIDVMADSLREDHRTAYDRQVDAEREVWNAQGRAREYDEPQENTLAVVEGVDEDSRFAEDFQGRYETEIDERERWGAVQRDSRNMFGGLSRMSDMMGGV